MQAWNQVSNRLLPYWFFLEISVHCLLIVLSFCTYSTLFYPALNSDHAITILMGHSFHLPHDWYFWGQDRMGSLIPLLAWPLNDWFGINSVVSESVIHYSLLLTGFLTFSTFIKKPVYRMALALLWFLPPFRMTDLMLLSFGIQYTLISVMCFLAFKIHCHRDALGLKEIVKWHLPFGIAAITGIWVSDLATISASILVIYLIYTTVKLNGSEVKSHFIGWLVFAGFALVCWYFISGLKENSLQHNYSEVASITTIKSSIALLFESIVQILGFQGNEPFTSIYAWFVILLLTTLFLTPRVSNSRNSFLCRFLIFDGLFILAAILITQWTYDNHVPRRYFTCTYVSFGMGILLYLDASAFKYKKYYNTFLMITLLTGGLGSIYNLKYIWPGTLKPRYEELSELKKLGKAGIIGDYWNSYVCSIGAPDSIISSPHQNSEVRNHDLVDKVFRQPSLYLVKDWWLDSFPDTITQFRHELIKSGIEFQLGGLTLNRYELRDK